MHRKRAKNTQCTLIHTIITGIPGPQRDWLDIDSRNGPSLQVVSCLLQINRELIMAYMMVVSVFLSLVWFGRGNLSKF